MMSGLDRERTYKGIEIFTIKMRSGLYRGVFQYPGYGPHIETPSDHIRFRHALASAQDVIDHLENGETKKSALYKTMIGIKAGEVMMYSLHIDRWNGTRFVYVGTVHNLTDYGEASSLSSAICDIDSPYSCRIKIEEYFNVAKEKEKEND